ncbi:hypothetical protein ACH9L7_15565 [Haloferax sp. S1W]|uniref:hypothetical protein n=1 Tax=Haloferax sp. S1W TaxID=3377110 RepID=UPI0037CA1173
MSNQLLQLLGSYDLFGKSVPGAALLFGILVLLPGGGSGQGFELSGSLVNIAALLVILLLIGLMVGQGLHTLADNIEKGFNWVLIAVVKIKQVIVVKFGIDFHFDHMKSPLYNKEGETSESDFNRNFLWSLQDGTVTWVQNRFWGTFDSLVSHRYLFHKWIVWNYETGITLPFDDRDIEGKRDLFLDKFNEEFEETFGVDPKDLVFVDNRPSNNRELERAYVLVTSYLAQKGIQGHRQFQSIYSFCRSLWVVFFILTGLYSLAIYQPFGQLGLLNQDPILFTMVPDTLLNLIPLVTAFATIVFFDASGTYKNHFIEYLIVSFVNAGEESESELGDQSNLNEF